MNLIVGALIAIYLLFLVLELTDLRRGRTKYIWALCRVPLAGIVLAGVLLLYAQPFPSISELIERKTIPFPNKKIHLDEHIRTTISKSFGRGKHGIFWYIHNFPRLYGVDPLLVRAVIEVESNFNAKAVSHNGARGLMQISPITAKHLGLNNVFDIRENIEGGVRYLRYLFELYGWNLHMTLASYNAGPANIQRYNGIPPFPETRRYVSKVIRVYERLKRTKEVFNSKSRLSSLLRQAPGAQTKTVSATR